MSNFTNKITCRLWNGNLINYSKQNDQYVTSVQELIQQITNQPGEALFSEEYIETRYQGIKYADRVQSFAILCSLFTLLSLQGRTASSKIVDAEDEKQQPHRLNISVAKHVTPQRETVESFLRSTAFHKNIELIQLLEQSVNITPVSTSTLAENKQSGIPFAVFIASLSGQGSSTFFCLESLQTEQEQKRENELKRQQMLQSLLDEEEEMKVKMICSKKGKNKKPKKKNIVKKQNKEETLINESNSREEINCKVIECHCVGSDLTWISEIQCYCLCDGFTK